MLIFLSRPCIFPPSKTIIELSDREKNKNDSNMLSYLICQEETLPSVFLTFLMCSHHGCTALWTEAIQFFAALRS